MDQKITQRLAGAALIDLQNQLVRLSNMIGSAFGRAVWALSNRDEAAARQVMDAENAVDLLAENLHDDCLQFIARYQPLGSDLRMVTSVMLMARDMERIGDYSENIARETLRLLDAPELPMLKELPRTGDIVSHMLALVMEGMSSGQADVELQVFPLDDQVDDLEGAMMKTCLTWLEAHPHQMVHAPSLINVIRTVERAGDHCTNLAEHAWYAIGGTRTRSSLHRRPKQNKGEQ